MDVYGTNISSLLRSFKGTRLCNSDKFPSRASESNHYLPNNYSCERSSQSTRILRANDKSTIVAVHQSRTIKYVARRKSFAKNISPISYLLRFLSFSPPRLPFLVLHGCSKFGVIAIQSRDGHFIQVEFEGRRIMDTRTRTDGDNVRFYASVYALLTPRLHVSPTFYLHRENIRIFSLTIPKACGICLI